MVEYQVLALQYRLNLYCICTLKQMFYFYKVKLSKENVLTM